MAELFIKSKEYDLAKSYLNEAIFYYDIHKEQKLWVMPWLSRAKAYLGEIFIIHGEFKSAYFILRESMEYAKLSQNNEAIAYSQMKLANIHKVIIFRQIRRLKDIIDFPLHFYMQTDEKEYVDELSTLNDYTQKYISLINKSFFIDTNDLNLFQIIPQNRLEDQL